MPKRDWLAPDSKSRRRIVALVIYVTCAVTFAVVAPRQLLTEHTNYNHFALLADAWLHGRQNILYDGPLGGPSYAGGNDFAQYQGKTYISFPPFPAVLMLPFVKLAGSPERFQDGQFMIWVAGAGPALLFLVLEKLRRGGQSTRSERENVALALIFAVGTVYFFTAVEGTVWFAGHVVGVMLVCGYLLYALDAENPLAAGAFLAASWMTRPTTVLLGLLFALEVIRVSCKDQALPGEGSLWARLRATWTRLDRGGLARRVALFAVPLLVAFGIASWMNYTRFGDLNPNAFGHEHLAVVWQDRIKRWGLFHYHYLPHNLGVMLTSMPWLPARGTNPAAPFQVSEHGLALWFTTPLYLWLLWPRRIGWHYAALALAAAGPLLMNLLYQNSGWRQFGYRFSNDYAPLLILMLALGGRPMGLWFKTAAAWAVAWNLFGAATFDRGGTASRYYVQNPGVLYQPD